MTIQSVLKQMNLSSPSAELFNQVAQQAAQCIAQEKSNKPTQLRRFYDEVVMWEAKSSLHPDKFEQYLPLIRMLNAKAAYAKGRKLVDQQFLDLIATGTNQVNSVESLRNFKLFFEAFMGFYKLERPSEN